MCCILRRHFACPTGACAGDAENPGSGKDECARCPLRYFFWRSYCLLLERKRTGSLIDLRGGHGSTYVVVVCPKNPGRKNPNHDERRGWRSFCACSTGVDLYG